MKLVVITVLGIVLAIAGTAMPALACDEDHPDFASGDEFGMHVAEHALEGMLSGECNPGMHSGYSPWAP